MKTSNIFLISYYFTDIIFMVIDKINEVTKYPHRIIVMDNVSVNSEIIRNKLREYVKLNKIHAAYFFDNNTLLNLTPMINNEEKADYTTISDGDAFILGDPTECWLTESIKMLESDRHVGITGFSSVNGYSAIKSRAGRRPITNNQWKVFTARRRSGATLPFNAHLMTFKTDFILSGVGLSAKFQTDGEIQRKIARMGYKSARYDRSSVYNLSTVRLGGDRGSKWSRLLGVDKRYQRWRPRLRGILRKHAGKFRRIGQ